MSPTDPSGSSRVRSARLALNASVTGVWLATLQWGAFFLLQSYLSSTALVWLVATLVWLAGSAVGLTVSRPRGELPWMLAAAGAYYALREVAAHHLYDLRWFAPLLVPVAVMGGYAGRFFRQRAAHYRRVKSLLLAENSGFVAGTVLVPVLLFLRGEVTLTLAPALAGAATLLTSIALPSATTAEARGHAARPSRQVGES